MYRALQSSSLFCCGNFVDVFKQASLSQLLRFLNSSHSRWTFVDVHPGLDLYSLSSSTSTSVSSSSSSSPSSSHSSYARAPSIMQLQHNIHRSQDHGVSHMLNFGYKLQNLLGMKHYPFSEYMQLLQIHNPLCFLELQHRKMARLSVAQFPGAVEVARFMMRERDSIIVLERDFRLLNALRKTLSYRPNGQQIQFLCEGAEFVEKVWPPLTSHGIFYLDLNNPALLSSDNETLNNYLDVLKLAVERFPRGTVVVSYPIVQHQKSAALLNRLVSTGVRSVLNLEVHVIPYLPRQEDSNSSSFSGFKYGIMQGVTGAGMAILNPPAGFDSFAKSWLPTLQGVLKGQNLSSIPEFFWDYNPRLHPYPKNKVSVSHVQAERDAKRSTATSRQESWFKHTWSDSPDAISSSSLSSSNDKVRKVSEFEAWLATKKHPTIDRESSNLFPLIAHYGSKQMLDALSKYEESTLSGLTSSYDYDPQLHGIQTFTPPSKKEQLETLLQLRMQSRRAAVRWLTPTLDPTAHITHQQSEEMRGLASDMSFSKA
eukprot:TRINITY_DN2024_c2_g1_i1.p1 TRINITY_DN2024_c2_g1~~TRINITY_DN2024_c2_g1_i1.p1  ORF type:complete len:540 (-),score=116.74 TRINITY_DN2024_c2_g1_i1:239-1858(-)